MSAGPAGEAHTRLGFQALGQRDLEEAERQFTSAIAAFSEADLPLRRADLLGARASLRWTRALHASSGRAEDLRGARQDMDLALALYGHSAEPRLRASAHASRARLWLYLATEAGLPELLDGEAPAVLRGRAAFELERAIACFAEVDDARGQLLLIFSEGQRLLASGSASEARFWYERARPLAERLGDAWSQETVAAGLSRIAALLTD